MNALQMKMTFLIGALFAIIYATIVLVGTAMGMRDFYFFLIISVGMMWIQYMIGPKIIEWMQQLKYIQRQDNPEVWDMVEEGASRAGIPMPKVCISPSPVPNAFAFGRGIRDGRVCVSEGIMRLLNKEELKAVIGHELTHIKNRDVLTITLISVIPMIMYRIAWHFMWYGGGNRNDRNAPSGFVVGIVAFLFYFITNLLVLYGSRVREYYADKGAVELGNKPAALASALYKLVYGNAKMADTEEMKNVEGMKAFYLNDPSQALNEINDLASLDLNKDGTIDTMELMRLRQKKVRVNSSDSLMELLSTHPNMLKRIQHLSTLSA